jgi:hypothetical protein
MMAGIELHFSSAAIVNFKKTIDASNLHEQPW